MDKAQAALLADGLLDTLGSDQEGLVLKDTLTEAVLIAAELAEDAQDNLNKSNKIATGGLSESIAVSEPEQMGTLTHIDITMNFYGKFVNAGVKGTKSGRSTEGYSFKNEFPSTKMVSAIAEWMKTAKKKVSSQTVKKYGTYGKHEAKQQTISTLGAAYALSRSIKMKGLKPTGFMDKAIQRASDKISDRLGGALGTDIINSITPE